MNRITLLLALIISPLILLSQTPTPGITVGMLWNDVDEMQEGYLLYSPTGADKSFLIDECGLKVKEWTFGGAYNYTGTYLAEDASVYKFVFNNGPGLNVSAFGDGCLEVRDWTDNQVWNYCGEDDYRGMHSDLHKLPNGNYLALLQRDHAIADVLALGINPSEISGGEFLTESVIEIEPTGPDSGDIVWEWHMYDHMIQDFDSTVTATYGNLADHPEKYDMGLVNGYIHFNSIDYSPELDIIVVSSWRNDEVYMIDHSTSTMEAAGSTGGNFGMGGDLIYRWGRPGNFLTGGGQKLNGQHNPRFVEEGPWVGSISVFNNEYGSISPTNGSAACIFTPVLDTANFVFQKSANGSFLPADFDFFWSGDVFPGDDMYSGIESGVDFLANGNFVVCEATSGRFTEVDENGNVVWIYQSPYNGASIVDQGFDVGYGAEVYKVEKYSPDYPAFIGQMLAASGTVENENSLSIDCGVDPNAAPNNALLQSINNAFAGACGNSFSPEITVTNFGSNPISEMEIEYSVNGGTLSSYTWTGTAFDFQEQETIILPEIFYFPVAVNDILITIVSVNSNPDDVPANNVLTDTFEDAYASLLGTHQVTVVSDQWGDEIKVEIIDDSGTTIFVQDGYPNNQPSTDQVDINDEGCYQFIVTDSYSDGLESPGYIQLNAPDGAVIAFIEGSYSVISEQFSTLSTQLEVPISSFTFLQDQQTVDFQNNSTGDELSYFWDFGNGENSTLENPEDIFFEPGSYDVCLITLNSAGSDTSCTTIVIYATGLTEFYSQEMKVFPIPSDNTNLFIELADLDDSATVQILNLDGKILISKLASSLRISDTVLELDISILANGTYILRYNDKDKTYFSKAIISK